MKKITSLSLQLMLSCVFITYAFSSEFDKNDPNKKSTLITKETEMGGDKPEIIVPTSTGEVRREIEFYKLPDEKRIKEATKEYNKFNKSQNSLSNKIMFYMINDAKNECLKYYNSIYTREEDIYELLKSFENPIQDTNFFSIEERESFKNYINQNETLERAQKDRFISYCYNNFLKSEIEEQKVQFDYYLGQFPINNIMKKCSTPYLKKTYLETLHKLGLNGDGTSVIVLESNFSTDKAVGFYGNNFEAFEKNDTHGRMTSKVLSLSSGGNILVVPSISKNKKYLYFKNEIENEYDGIIKEKKLFIENEKIKVLQETSKLCKSLINITLDSVEVSKESQVILNTKKNELEKTLQKIHEDIENLITQKNKKIILTREKYGITDVYDSIEEILKIEISGNILRPHIINISLNCNNTLNANSGENLQKLTDVLKKNDLLLIFSAGNMSSPLPRNFKDIFQKYPDLKERILFVGATTPIGIGEIAYFSNTPGEFGDIFVYAPGEGIQINDYNSEKIISIDGTSFSAPIVSAFMTILKKYFPLLDMITIKKIVLESASPFPSSLKGYNDKTKVGCGQLDAFKAFLSAKKTSEDLQKKEVKKFK